MNYLSDYITTTNLNEWLTNKEDILLIANAGAGKTYLLLNQLVTEAQIKGLKVLYCYNRKTMRTQFAEEYANKYDNLTITSYQSLEKQQLFSNEEAFLTQYDVILCDECHYFVADSFTNTTYISFEKIQRNNAMKIYFTATPVPFEAIAQLTHKPFKTFDMRSLTRQNVDEIELVQETSLFDEAEAHYLKSNTVVHFENNKDHNNFLALKYQCDDYKTVAIDKDTDNEVTQMIESTNSTQNVFVDFLATTSTNENGVNFNIANNSVITFKKCVDFTSIVQSAARLRKYKGNQQSKIKMLVNMPHKNLMIKGIERNTEELEMLYLKRSKALAVEFITIEIEYDFKIAKLEEENKTFKEMLQYVDLTEYYTLKLAELYSNAIIKTIDKHDLLPIEEVLNDVLCTDDEIILDPDFQKLIKAEIGCGVNVINNKMHGKFEIITSRKTVNKDKITFWTIKRI